MHGATTNTRYVKNMHRRTQTCNKKMYYSAVPPENNIPDRITYIGIGLLYKMKYVNFIKGKFQKLFQFR